MRKLSLTNYWHPNATINEVGDKPLSCRLLGEELVAFRDRAGVAVFRDVCVHRGAALSGGRVKDGILTCPYHGWGYNLSGACVQILSLPAGAAIPPKARAIVYKVREAYGLIWVAMREPVQPFPEWPQDAWNRRDYRVLFVNQYRWRTSAGRVIENAMDFSHFNFVHRGFTELADGPVIRPYSVTSNARGFTYAYEDGRLRRDYTLEFPFIIHDCKNVIRVEQEGATWSEDENSRVGDATMLSFIASPVDATTTKIYAYTARNHHLEADDREFIAGFDTIMEQDRVVVETQRPEQIPVDIKEELHLRLPDAASIAYRRLLQELDHVEPFIP